MALTATAAPPVRSEIVRRLGPARSRGRDRRLRPSAARALCARRALGRPTSSESSEVGGGRARRRGDRLRRDPRRRAEAARDTLVAAGNSVALYHAGLTPRERREAMAAFLDGSGPHRRGDRGLRDGHRQAGRALGRARRSAAVARRATTRRSGVPAATARAAHARLLYRPEDFGAAVHLAARGVSTEAVARVAAAARHWRRARRREHAARRRALVRLVDLGRGRVGGRRGGSLDGRAHGRGRDGEPRRPRRRVRTRSSARASTMMRRYAEHTGCRRSFLLSYFGQDYPGPCGNCDNDRTARARQADGAAVRGRRARHERALGRRNRAALRRRPADRALRRSRLSRSAGAARRASGSCFDAPEAGVTSRRRSRLRKAPPTTPRSWQLRFLNQL